MSGACIVDAWWWIVPWMRKLRGAYHSGPPGGEARLAVLDGYGVYIQSGWRQEDPIARESRDMSVVIHAAGRQDVHSTCKTPHQIEAHLGRSRRSSAPGFWIRQHPRFRPVSPA